VYVYVCVGACEGERMCVCKCVCVWFHEVHDRTLPVCVCMYVWASLWVSECVCASVCVCGGMRFMIGPCEWCACVCM